MNMKPQIEPQVKTDQAVAGFAEIGKAAEGMGRRVSEAGKDAAKGVDGLGDGAKPAADKLDRATRSIIGSIERTTAALQAGERGSASYFETLAKQRGISGEALAPYIAQLRQAEVAQKAATQSLGTMGVSAAQTAAALRNVPAQFTDIITSLQGGQAPLTVLLQQGGQLKDMFGGVGAAAKALGGFVAGLITPFTVVGAAVAALGAGFLMGRKEAEEFNKALVLTGNQTGVTVGQLSAMASRLDALGTTQGKASEVLTQFASSGRVSAENLERFTLAAINLEKVGGPAVEETVKAFAELGKDPLQASLKLNESTNFLTRSLYEQIQALQDQGRTLEAAKVAQEAYSAAVEDRVPKIVEQLGYVERAWKGIVALGAEAIDGLKSVGRVDNTLQAAIARTEREAAAARAVGDALAANEADRLLERLQESLKLEQDVGKAIAANAEQTRARAAADKELEALGVKRVTLAQQEEALRARLVAGGKDELTIQKAITALREKSAPKGGQSSNSAARELEREADVLAELAGLTKSYNNDLAALQKSRASGLLTEARYVEALTALVLKQPFAIAQAKALADANKQVADAEARGLEIRAQYLAGLDKGAASVAQQVQALQDEAKASAIAAAGQLSLAQAMQQVAIARLQDQQAAAGGDAEAVAAIQREIDKRRELIGLIGGKELADAAAAANKELDRLFDPSKAQSFGDALSGAFAQAGSSLAKLSGTLEAYGRTQASIAERQAVVNAATDPAKKQREQLKLNEASQRNQIALYANMAGAAKGFFKEGTQGYKTLEAAETAFRAYQLASDLIKGISAAKVAILNQAQGDPYTAFARMAAMAAAVAALGFAVSGGFAKGGSTGGDGAKQATGQGTVFGDAQAKSESINKATERLADTARLQLTTQSGMLAALRNIENTIGGITNLVVRSGQVRGTAADRFGINVGTRVDDVLTTGFLGNIVDQKLFGGKFTQSQFGKTTRITGSGLFAGAQDLGSIIGNGLNLQDYADINSSKKLFGIKVSNKNSTQYSPADEVLQQQFGLVFKNFYDAIKLASTPLDAALSDVTARLDSFVVDIGKIDLAGLTGEQIQEKLAAVLGAAGDSIAAAALPGLEAFQNVGEGYFETVVRVASGVETAGAALELLGINAINFTDIAKKQGDVAAEIVRQSIAGFESLDGSLSSVGGLINTLDGSADDLLEAYRSLVDVRDVLISVGESGDSLTAAMIRGAGGLEKLQSSLSDYLENFFSEAEQTAAGRSSLQGQFSRLGLGELPKTREAFRELVEGVNTSTESGQKLYAQLVGLSGAFAELVPATATLADNAAEAAERIAEAGRRALESLGQSRQQLEVELLRAQGNEAGAIARERANALARSTAGLNATDTAAVASALAYNNALADQITSLRAATEAQKAAAQAAQQAIAEAQRRADAILSERTSLEDRLLQLQGDTTALRARELAGLDASNRALLERIFALQDAQTAEQAAAEAASAAADATRQAAEAAAQALDALNAKLSDLAGTRFDLENELLGLNGNAGEVARRTRERDLAGLTQGLSATDAARVTAAYDFNLALRQQIEATKAAQEAAKNLADEQARAADEAQRAADQFRSAWQSITDTLFDEVARIRGLLGIGSGSSLASAQAQFAITTAQARAGDQEAAKLLPGLSQTLLGLAEQSAASLIDLQRIRAQVAASLEQTGTGLAGRFGLTVPRLEVGTNYVPRDMLAMLHEGEAVVPRAYNPAAGGEGSVALVQEVRGLREDNKAQALAIVKLQADLGRIVKRWDTDGMPEVRATA